MNLVTFSLTFLRFIFFILSMDVLLACLQCLVEGVGGHGTPVKHGC